MVGLVLVSHSPKIAEGTADLVRQMAGKVEIAAVGGDSEGGFGTDPERIEAAIKELGADDVLVFMDLGSAVLSAETVMEMLPSDTREKVRLVDAPFVEGAFAAGVLASAGSDAVPVDGPACWPHAASTSTRTAKAENSLQVRIQSPPTVGGGRDHGSIGRTAPAGDAWADPAANRSLVLHTPVHSGRFSGLLLR